MMTTALSKQAVRTGAPPHPEYLRADRFRQNAEK